MYNFALNEYAAVAARARKANARLRALHIAGSGVYLRVARRAQRRTRRHASRARRLGRTQDGHSPASLCGCGDGVRAVHGGEGNRECDARSGRLAWRRRFVCGEADYFLVSDALWLIDNLHDAQPLWAGRRLMDSPREYDETLSRLRVL
jgi:hypothetical protein